MHDALLAPLVTVVGLALAWLLPAWLRGPVAAALALSGLVLLFSYPLLRAFGRRPSNPTILPHDYTHNVLFVLAAIWSVALAVVLVRHLSATNELMIATEPTALRPTADAADSAPTHSTGRSRVIAVECRGGLAPPRRRRARLGAAPDGPGRQDRSVHTAGVGWDPARHPRGDRRPRRVRRARHRRRARRRRASPVAVVVASSTLAASRLVDRLGAGRWARRTHTWLVLEARLRRRGLAASAEPGQPSCARTFPISPTHPIALRGHPPGFVLLFGLMDRVGLGGAGWATTVACSSAPAPSPRC